LRPRPDKADSQIAFRPDCAGPPSQAFRRNGKIRHLRRNRLDAGSQCQRQAE
jgi:hypothetical protein